MINQAGELRHQIQILALNADVGDECEVTTTESVVCNCWAAVKDVVQREAYDADARQLLDTVNFTVRWRTGITPGMLVVFGGVRHEIKQVNQQSHLRDFMTLQTVRRAVTA